MIVYSNFPLLYVCGAQNAAHSLFDRSAKLQTDRRCDPQLQRFSTRDRDYGSMIRERTGRSFVSDNHQNSPLYVFQYFMLLAADFP